MTDVLPFTPGGLVTLTAGTGSAAFTLPGIAGQIIIYVKGSVEVVFKLGAATAVAPDGTAATAGVGAFVVAPGTTQTFTVGDQTSLAYIAASSSVFYLMYGQGE